jgi:hypothetical protein
MPRGSTSPLVTASLDASFNPRYVLHLQFRLQGWGSVIRTRTAGQVGAMIPARLCCRRLMHAHVALRS